MNEKPIGRMVLVKGTVFDEFVQLATGHEFVDVQVSKFVNLIAPASGIADIAPTPDLIAALEAGAAATEGEDSARLTSLGNALRGLVAG